MKMRLHKPVLRGALVCAALLVATAARAQPASGQSLTRPASRQDSCFQVQNYRAFRPEGDRTFLIRVNVDDYFRIGLISACPQLSDPSSRLVIVIRGDTLICAPTDWELKVGEPGSFAAPCFVKSQTRLTPAEVAAIPPKLKP